MTANKRVRAVGYVRVSTEGQAAEGVSLDAQRRKIKAHCLAHDLSLVELFSDDGASAKSLDRPGLRHALRLLEAGKAEALVVVKLDRLTRSVKDLGHLSETYFCEGRPWSLLAVSDSIDTRSAAGKLVLNVLMSVAQWEREAICERTREGMQQLKALGVQVGKAPYGWRYGKRGADGRRVQVEDAHEQAGIRRALELYEADVPLLQICERLTDEGYQPRGKCWYVRSLALMLERAGVRDVNRLQKSAPSTTERRKVTRDLVRDQLVVAARARELRAEGKSLRQIGSTLLTERLYPQRGAVWHAAGVSDLLRRPSLDDVLVGKARG